VKRKKMNTKIIVALVVGLALVGLTGAASAAYYNLSADYVYVDSGANNFNADTLLNTSVTGTNPSGNPTHMHNWVDTNMTVGSVSSPATNVAFRLVQGAETALTIRTRMPGNRNTFKSSDIAFQELEYVANGDAFDIDFDAESRTHASTHEGILPIGQMAVWDYNVVDADAWVSKYWNGDKWVPQASIKSGNLDYTCTTHAEAEMEAEHVLGPVTAGSGITVSSNADGEIWDPFGTISNDVDGYQDVWMWWPTP
jgi:hypothetical protein